jgi:hypothetical protein
MYQQIGGFIDDLIPFGIFLYITLVLFGVVKLNNKPKFLENPPKYLKIAAIVGLICFSILIIIRIVELI